MRAVMYHYVRPGPDRPPFEYYYLDLDDFRRQLDHLQERYDLIDRDTFRSYVSGEATPSSDAAILTFDDGLADHYEWVLPELQERDLWGLFFLPGPIETSLLPVHRVHLLLGVASAEELVSALCGILDRDENLRERADAFGRIYEESDEDMATFKRALNYLLPYDHVPEVLGAIESRFPRAREVDPSDYYMSPDQMRKLEDAGMLLGGHSVTHPVMSRLGRAEQRAEITSSLAYVDELADEQSLRSFAYPFGATGTFDEDTRDIVRTQDCDIAFTTESGDVSSTEFRENPLTLPRRDCNEFPHGDASRY